MSNCFPPGPAIWYVPRIMPVGVFRGHHDEYLNDSPGASTGWAPTTPGPRTSSTWSSASVIIQCRLSSCTVSGLWFVMRTVYWKTHSPCDAREFSSECCDITSTRIPLVTASDTGARSDNRSGMQSYHTALWGAVDLAPSAGGKRHPHDGSDNGADRGQDGLAKIGEP